MIAVLVAVLSASSALAALWPLVRAEGPTFALVFRSGAADSPPPAASKGCRRVQIIKAPRGRVTQGCSSARKRPCLRRRAW